MLEGDSIEYELIEKCCQLIKSDNPFTLEIGVRLGKGSETILKSLKNKNHWHVGVDPYGELRYQHFDKDSDVKHSSGVIPTYPNSMKTTVLQNLNFHNFILLPMCDTEFMEKYCNGVPIYNKLKTIRNDYDLVLLDGPHTTYDVLKEVMFFGERLNNNGILILDDWPTYKSPMIVDIAKMLDIKPLHIGENKLVLKKYD